MGPYRRRADRIEGHISWESGFGSGWADPLVKGKVDGGGGFPQGGDFHTFGAVSGVGAG